MTELAQEILEKELERLTEENNKLSDLVDFYKNGSAWQAHRTINENIESSTIPGYDKLPYPRLEMRINSLHNNDWDRIEYIYGMIIKHYNQCISECDKNILIFIPLGLTTCTGSYRNEIKNRTINLPFRDGLHIKADSIVYKIPAYLIYDGYIEKIKCTLESISLETISKMTRE